MTSTSPRSRSSRRLAGGLPAFVALAALAGCGGADAPSRAGDGAGATTGASGVGGAAGASFAGAGGVGGASVPGAGGVTGSPAPCRVIDVEPLRGGVQAATAASVEGWLLTGLGAPPKDLFTVQIVDRGGALGPGTYDLSLQTDLATCTHCVVVLEDSDSFGAETRAYVQERGTLVLEEASSPPTVESRGRVENLILVEATLDPNDSFRAVAVPGGTCLEIDVIEWDTIVADGEPCEVTEDCGNPARDVCDPATRTCAPSQCGYFTPSTCDEGFACLFQKGATAGACYPSCTPFDPEAACADGAECVASSHDGDEGACRAPGPAAANAPCSESDVTTGCEPGYLCTNDPSSRFCRRRCDFFSPEPACDPGQACMPPGICAAEKPDPAALGQPCATSLSTPCGNDGFANRGVCAHPMNNPTKLVCARWCHFPSLDECDAGTQCQPTNMPSLGYCT